VSRKLRTDLCVVIALLLGCAVSHFHVPPPEALLFVVGVAMALNALFRPWRD